MPMIDKKIYIPPEMNDKIIERVGEGHVSSFIREAIEEKLSFDNPTSIEILMKQRDKLEKKKEELEKATEDYDKKILKLLKEDREREKEEMEIRLKEELKQKEKEKKDRKKREEKIIKTFSKLNGIDAVLKEFDENVNMDWYYSKVDFLRSQNPAKERIIGVKQLEFYLKNKS